MNQVPDWREKYRVLTEQFDAQARTWKQLEDILRRLVRRLCAAAQGVDARLDEELRVVAATIRTAESAGALDQLLSRVTTAVTAFDATRALTGQHREASAPPAAAAPVPAPDSPADGIAGLEVLAEPLLLVLDRLGLVASDKSEADAVRSGLSEPPSMAAFEQAVWRLGDLIAAERTRLETEKAESERVLKQVSARLGEIASFLAASQADQGEADRSGRELNDRLRGEVQEIGSTVQVATDLGDLQVAVKSRLEAIDGHLQAFRAREERRSHAYRERAERMGERIQQL